MYQNCTQLRSLKKGQTLYAIGETPNHFAFLHKGLMRAYVIDEQGNEFNKTFFAEGRFPGSMSALLKNTPSFMAVDALEDCQILEIDFKKFREALFKNNELMAFHINYLETHWLLEKEPKEIGYLQFEAKQRYLQFLVDYKHIVSRLAQYHIASYLGITPTQLSRIKKDLK
ncbi:Crp/Fnr family transcriptional regulator [Pseudoalteromonas sp. SSM20]|uniref:Crp/Fnr family transcriptional regulator n=1 Tax=Pseudoalteromonas sp. SSM20 TaxID=3139394 RepID=UPI003BADB649